VQEEPAPAQAPAAGWTLELAGKVTDTITQAEFEEGLACTGSGHYVEWTDKDGQVWSGTPLWVLLGAVDDIETGSHWTFSDDAVKAGYTVRVVAGDGFSRTFDGAAVARNNDYIVADKCDGKPLTGSSAPLRLVGNGVVKEDGSLGGNAVGNIVRIEIPELQTPPAQEGSWNLTLTGEIKAVLSQAEFEEALACPNSGHRQEWTDAEGNVWSGMPLWLLAGWVDDRQPHAFNAPLATAGYKILVKGGDGFVAEYSSQDVARSNDYILANQCNGKPLEGELWPLCLVGDGPAPDGKLGDATVWNVVEIALTSLDAPQTVPELRIVKYGEDGKTIIAEKVVDYKWMRANLEVIGDGKTVYKFEGITNDPNDVWDAAETYPGGFKIANAVMGTRLRDLCELVGGMGAGTEIVLVARDGYETRLPYSSIYPDPSVQARQGDAILAWWADGKFVPEWIDGMRLYFTPEDHVYGQWDMHETLPEQYWHYYYADGVQYPSCAGLSAKWITELRVYSVPQGDWTLKLDGTAIGGLQYEVSKTYFEQALACQFGANHKASYTDDKGRVWEGMPLWLLAGFVDDEDLHSNNAFNDQLARAGYQVVLTAADGYTVTIDSADIIRNTDYIVANTLNGAPIPEDSGDWPLRLVGPAVKGGTSISQISRIELLPASGKPGGLTDLAGHWAEDYIRELVERGVISGYPDGTFKPDSKITRAEFVAILVKAFGLEGQGDRVFADTAGHWAREVIAGAAQRGIASGYDENTFGPDDPVTREQMATMLVKAAGLEPWRGEIPFADGDRVRDWAREAVATALHHALISGYPDNTFRPGEHATRAEAATVVVKALAAK